MKVGMAYLGVIVIWSTTPLAIKWSNSSLSYMTAITVRVVIAVFVCLALLIFLRKPLIRKASDWNAFLAGALGVFPNMALVYWSAQYLPSGLISVVFGFYPFMVGLFSLVILKQNVFNFSRVSALVIALVGLAIINLDKGGFGSKAAWGLSGIFVSTIFFSLSTVWVKAVGASLAPSRQLAGSLLIAAPCFLASWLATGQSLPEQIDMRSIAGVIYLVFAGTIIGGLAFYFVLSKCRVATVSLIPLLTPVVALAVGHFVEGERLSTNDILGSFLIIFSLAVYQGVFVSVDFRNESTRNIARVNKKAAVSKSL